MKIASSRISSQAEILMEAQTKIKHTIKDSFLRGYNKARTWDMLKVVILLTVKRLPLQSLHGLAIKALAAFCERQYRTLFETLARQRMSLLAAIFILNKSSFVELKLSGNTVQMVQKEVVRMETKAMGIPLSKYAKDYMRENVNPVLEWYAKQYVLDPGDVSGNNSLRNRAEMEVRYNGHLQQIEELKERNVRLVYVSVHADCSKRCAPYQGKIYSLDGTHGKTKDNREYGPLENATQNEKDIYITKAGKVYQNGLLGFNCRHALHEFYEGVVIEHVSKETQERQYAITKKQREYERLIRMHKDLSVTYSGIDRDNFKKNNVKIKQLIHEYKKFSTDNQRAIYSDRYALF